MESDNLPHSALVTRQLRQSLGIDQGTNRDQEDGAIFMRAMERDQVPVRILSLADWQYRRSIKRSMVRIWLEAAAVGLLGMVTVWLAMTALNGW